MSSKDRADAVRSREDLIGFLAALAEDLANHGEQWGNPDLASFLEAMVGWSQDMKGYYANRGEDPAHLPPWRIVADLLMAARIYE